MARNFSNLLDAWMQFEGGASAAPKTFIRWSFISVLASALERRVWMIKGHQVGFYPNLYIFVVGPAGSGKSTVAEKAMGLLQELGKTEFILGSTNGSTLMTRLSEVGESKFFNWNNKEYPHCAVTIFASEASEVLQPQYKGGDIIGRLTEGYNCGPFGWSMLHGMERLTRVHGNVRVINPCINLLACSTPEWLITKCMTKNDAEGGFGSRILLVVSRSGLEHEKSSWDAIDLPSDLAMRVKIMEDLQRVLEMRGPYSATPGYVAAATAFEKEYLQWRRKQAATGILGGYQQRKMVQLYKVSMCLAAAKRDDMLLLDEDIEEAWQYLAEIEPTMVETLSELEMSPDAIARRDIYEFLVRNGFKEISRQDLFNKFSGYSLAQMENAIRGLLITGKLEQTDSRATGVRLIVRNQTDLKL